MGDVTGRKAVVIFVPFKLLKVVHKIQSRLVRELEKKFSGKHVVLIGQRRIMRKPSAGQRQPKQKRPVSRTLTAVHESILEDLVYPTEIVGKHTRYRLDGSKICKVYLDPKEAPNVEYKVDTFATVYKRLTGKEVKFESVDRVSLSTFLCRPISLQAFFLYCQPCTDLSLSYRLEARPSRLSIRLPVGEQIVKLGGPR